jgi:replicative DNA helicase
VGGVKFVQALSADWPAKSRMVTWAKTVREKAATRLLLTALSEAQELVMGDGDLAAKLDRVQSMIEPLAASQIRNLPRTLGDVALLRTQHYEALEAGTVEPGWRTGIDGLDRLLSGGLRAGRMVVLAARPAVGKSSLAQFVAQNVARDGRKALILSQEMAAEDLADRAFASMAGVGFDNLQSGKLDRDQWSRISNSLADEAMLNVVVDDSPALRLSDIRAKVRAVKGVRLVVVDYLQLMSGSSESPSRNSNRESEIAGISRGLKAMAMELGVCVVALSQLNREVEQRADKRPNLSNLRESGAIEQDADVVAMLWPVKELEGGARLIGMSLAKNRIGRTGDLALHFEGRFQHWGESTESLHQPAATRRTGIRDCLVSAGAVPRVVLKTRPPPPRPKVKITEHRDCPGHRLGSLRSAPRTSAMACTNRPRWRGRDAQTKLPWSIKAESPAVLGAWRRQ